MTRVLRHVRQNVVAYLALFVALGGTSYAAIAIPRNSVGASQIRNHSIDPVKLSNHSFGGFVFAWAQVDRSGRVYNSSPTGATTVGWTVNSTNGSVAGVVRWHLGIARRCFSAGSAVGPPSPTLGTTSTDLVSGTASRAGVVVFESESVPVNVAVVCPTP